MNESNNVSSHIPDLISFMIILFYMETDYFYKPGNDIKISQDGLTAVRMKQDSFSTTTYCKQWIPSTSNMIITWKFKVGTIKPMKNKIRALGSMREISAYGDQDDGYCTGNWFENGDEITFTLDLKSRETIFQRNNDINTIERWRDVKVGENVRYKLAICLFYQNVQITLIDYCKEYRQ